MITRVMALMAGAAVGAVPAYGAPVASDFRNPESLAEARDLYCYDRHGLGSPEPRIGVRASDFEALAEDPKSVVRVQTCIGELAMNWRMTIMNVAGGNQMLFVDKTAPKLALQINRVSKSEGSISLCYLPSGIDEARGKELSLCGRLRSTKQTLGIFEVHPKPQRVVGDIKGGARTVSRYGEIFSDNPRSKALITQSHRACAEVRWGLKAIRLYSPEEYVRKKACEAKR